MSLNERTNETIRLSLHRPQTWEPEPEWPEGGQTPAGLVVDQDGDSSSDPQDWVHIDWTDDEHDSDSIKLTYDEAGMLHDRLSLILGRPPYTCKGCNGHPHAADGEDPAPGYTCPDCMGSGLYAGSISEHAANGGEM